MPVELIAQVVHPVDKDRKRELLAHLVKSNNWHQVLVFAKTKHGANRLAEQLSRDGIEADAIHGNKSQPQRMRALKRFKDNELQVLVATDIASRGIDIESLPHVVNYDLPNVSEDYVHRIGRTGRAGESGEAVTLLCGEDRPLLSAIERLINRKIEQKIVAGFEPSNAYHSAKPEARQARGQQRRNEPRRHEQKRGEQRGRPERSSRGPQPAAQGRRGKGPRREQSGAPDKRQDERWSDQDQKAIREQQRMHHQRQQAAGSQTQKTPALLGNFGRKAA
jgi:ATP-dependent RNA helicase RhlE